MNSYTVSFSDNQEKRQTYEQFASNLKQAIIAAQGVLQKQYGFNFLLLDVKPTQEGL